MENTRTRIKICGITRPEDARCAALLGADAIGLVFHEPSRRCVEPEQARAIIAALPAFVTVTGLFVNAERDRVREILEAVPLDVLQFHGEETEAYCAGFSRPYIKALRVRMGVDVEQAVQDYGSASAVLLDAWHEELAGGTGAGFDWKLIPREPLPKPLVLAGGLHSGNVPEGIETVRPYAVDVSSGVEAAPGIKSAEKMRQFVNAVSQAGNF